MPADIIVLLGLVALSIIAFGSYVAHGGLYFDDWTALAIQRHPPDPGPVGVVREYVSGSDFITRPGLAVVLMLANTVFGADASWHLALGLGLAVALSVAFYTFLRELTLDRMDAGLIAGLLLLFPWSDTTRLWPIVSLINLAMALFLAGAIIALRGLRSHRPVRQHVLAATLYGLSLVTYEAAAGVIPFMGLLYLTRTGWRQAASRAGIDTVIVVGALALVRTLDHRGISGIGESVKHARTIADEAATVFAAALTPSGTPRWLAGGVSLVVIGAGAWAASRLRDGVRARIARRYLLLTLAGIGGATVAYLVYLPATAWYVPLQPGEGNRVNAMAALGYVVAVYGTVALGVTLVFRPRRMATALIAVAAVALAVAYLHRLEQSKAAWARAAAIQAQVLGAVERALPHPPSSMTVYAFAFPRITAPGVPVFFWPSDFSGALRVTSGDPSISGYPMIDGTVLHCGSRSVLPAGSGYGPRSATAYGRTVFVDASTGRVAWIVSRDACRRAVQSFVPGPGRWG